MPIYKMTYLCVLTNWETTEPISKILFANDWFQIWPRTLSEKYWIFSSANQLNYKMGDILTPGITLVYIHHSCTCYWNCDCYLCYIPTLFSPLSQLSFFITLKFNLNLLIAIFIVILSCPELLFSSTLYNIFCNTTNYFTQFNVLKIT